MNSHCIIFSCCAIALLACKRSTNTQSDRDDSPATREWIITRPAPATATASEQTLAVPVQPTLVRQGSLPLVYIVESRVTVTITDATSGAQIARAAAEPSTIIRVEPKNGVYFNTRQLAPGPLDPQHDYAIYVHTDGGKLDPQRDYLTGVWSSVSTGKD